MARRGTINTLTLSKAQILEKILQQLYSPVVQDTHRRFSSLQINMLTNAAFAYCVLSHALSRWPYYLAVWFFAGVTTTRSADWSTSSRCTSRHI